MFNLGYKIIIYSKGKRNNIIYNKNKSDKKMNNFKGLIPKSIMSDESMRSLVNKTEQFRKITQQST